MGSSGPVACRHAGKLRLEEEYYSTLHFVASSGAELRQAWAHSQVSPFFFHCCDAIQVRLGSTLRPEERLRIILKSACSREEQGTTRRLLLSTLVCGMGFRGLTTGLSTYYQEILPFWPLIYSYHGTVRLKAKRKTGEKSCRV